jgi:hypothetical protein
VAPTFKIGKSTVFKVRTGTTVALGTGVLTGGSTLTLSSGFADSNMDRSAGTSDVTTYGDDDMNYIPALRSGQWSANGIFASTYESQLAASVGSTGLGIDWSPHGSASGARRFTAGVILTAFNVGAPVGDKVSMNLTFQRTGALRSTTN